MKSFCVQMNKEHRVNGLVIVSPNYIDVFVDAKVMERRASVSTWNERKRIGDYYSI